MAHLELRNPVVINVIIIIVGLLAAGFLLLMGVANWINPDVPDAYLEQNTVACLVVCFAGMAPLLVAIAAFRGILHRKKGSGEQEQI